MTIEQITDTIWSIPGEVKVVPGVYFPCRSTVVKRNNGQLWMHSPVNMSQDDIDGLKALGDVTDIIAPNTFHHLFLPKAIEAYPEATVWGARGLHKKREDINFDHILGTAEADWDDELDSLLIEGCPGFNERVFFDRTTETLIVTDLIFNMHTPKTFMTSTVLKTAGVYKRTSQSRLWRTVVKDKKACKASIEKMLQWPIKRLVMAHGIVVEDDAHNVTKNALKWMLSF